MSPIPTPSLPSQETPICLDGQRAEPPIEIILEAADLASLSLGLDPIPKSSKRSARVLPVELFLPKKLASAEQDRRRSENPVFFAVFSGRLDALTEALKQDPEGAGRPLFGDALENQHMSFNYTPLHVAARLNNAEAARLLVQAGADPNRFIARVSSVGISAYNGSHNALQAMLELGADAKLTLKPEHSVGNAGSTLLHRVLERSDNHNRLWVVQTLIRSGQYPDPLLATEAGETPLDCAVETWDQSVTWLRSYIAQLERLCIAQSTPLRTPGKPHGLRV